MSASDLQHRETRLIEALLSGLDARESARSAEATMLVYLSELFIKRTREELAETRQLIDTMTKNAARGDATS